MDCRGIEFSPEKSSLRIERALRVFPSPVLLKILVFALYLLGATRRAAADTVEMPEQSVKTMLRLVLKDGFPALQDRRYSATHQVPIAPVPRQTAAARRDGDSVVFSFGVETPQWRVPLEHQVELKTVLLSLYNSDIISTKQVAELLGIGEARCRILAKKLSHADVEEALIDKRRGQTQDIKVGPALKAQIIQHYAARAVAGHSTSSEEVANSICTDSERQLSPRTVRWHVAKLGLSLIKHSLPELVETLKKNS
jgi:hypothetical protein